MKPGERSKLLRNLRQESRRFRLLVVVIGFFLVTLTFIVVTKPEAILFADVGKKPNSDEATSSIVIEERTSVQRLDEIPRVRNPGVDASVRDNNEGTEVKGENEDNSPTKIQRNIAIQTKEEEEIQLRNTIGPDQFGNNNGNERSEEKSEDKKEEVKHKVTLPTVSNYTINDSIDTKPDETTSTEVVALQTNEQTEPTLQAKSSTKHLCDFTNFRANVCDMEGEIVIHPNSSSIFFKEPAGSTRDEQWKIRPYPRKGDDFCLSHTSEITVKSTQTPPQCTQYHDVPGIIFSVTGYTGNLFHDFTDVMVPLFTTANQFNGEVKFLISDMMIWWVRKYHRVLEALSNYPVIDFKNDNEVHCFKHVIVGLHAYMEFTIDSKLAPKNYSMVDFNAFMRRAYGLKRDSVTVLGEQPSKKPRLLIISRKRTRTLLNLNEIVEMAKDIGYEVVVNEADVSSRISQMAEVVNSCDVMMGVHGAGLTNCVFLPRNGTLIQIVPWGALDWISRIDFGDPSTQMGLHYMHYSISVEESSLLEEYPRDHEVFRNPVAFHKNGFDFVKKTFMDNQNVRLDVKRFRSVLLEALDHLTP
ncbi:Glycosyltransferase family 61 protein [Rhynchospora pubera]|uniref:Glycosyltransferase family 61 protein n=1 Tax=Rhynchospora pubera TaxID=906938 RepID=A0AAV8GYR7_9POAL|nr:Glycosyltransferase family 61 protein [Rhynchospora pubera]